MKDFLSLKEHEKEHTPSFQNARFSVYNNKRRYDTSPGYSRACKSAHPRLICSQAPNMCPTFVKSVEVDDLSSR
jgi:hypothetical protein